MNDRMMSPDALAAAACTEMDAVQREIEAAWDVEAGLREVLLAEQYREFADEPPPGFDVEAGLADVLKRAGGLSVPKEELHVFVVTTCEKDILCEVELPESQPTTFDLIRQLAESAMFALHELGEPTADLADAQAIKDYAHLLVRAAAWTERLMSLADALEFGTAGLDEALDVLARTAHALLQLATGMNDVPVGRLWHIGELPVRQREIVTLARAVTQLEGPIKKLFDWSDDMVGLPL